MSVRLRILVGGVAALWLLVLCSSAQADFQGTPGKVAWVENRGEYPLKIWDPAKATPREPNKGIETVVRSTFHIANPLAEIVTGEPSPPVFSPDGTKYVYSKLVADNPPPEVAAAWHTALYVANANGRGEPQQITHPQQALYPPPECEENCPGHITADYMPSWSADGKTIYFIRDVGASESDQLYSEIGLNVWSVSASGGGATQVTSGELPAYLTTGGAVKGGGVAVTYGDGSGQHLGVLNGGAPTAVASPRTGIIDYDVSPDGEHLTYTTVGGTGVENHTVNATGGEDESLGKVQTSLDRWSPSGNGPLQTDCHPIKVPGRTIEQCGIFERHTPDSERESKPNEQPDRFAFPWIGFTNVGSTYGRYLWDVQAQQLPIIFVPGFLGSTIRCEGSTIWPPGIGNPRPALDKLDLQSDGVTNANCPDAGPDGTLVESVLGKEIYEGVPKFHRRLRMPETAGGQAFPTYTFGWDWRKQPQQSLQRLEELVNRAMEHPLQEEEGARRVVLWGHSYGGLLIRTFLNEHPEQVARVLTVGTPYWGSPKALFPLAFGVETPLGSGLDALLNNEELQRFAQNMAGVYQLFPSPPLGPWLSENGVPLSGNEISSFILGLGGQPSLYGQAQSNHSNLYDGFFNNYETIDYRAVVGAGLPTVSGIDIHPLAAHEADVRLTLESGDGTVPEKSAIQGSIEEPLGAPVRIQEICGVEHVPLPNDTRVQHAYEEFLEWGRTPYKLDTPPCGDPGGVLEFATKRGLTLGAGYSSSKIGPQALLAKPAISLEQATEEESIDLFNLNPQLIAVLSAHKPVSLSFQATDLRFTYTIFENDHYTTRLSYGPLTGEVVLAGGEGTPAVTLNGTPIAGVVETEPISAPGGNSPAAGSSSNSTTVPGGPSASNLFVLRKIKLARKGQIVLSLTAPGRGRLQATATYKTKKHSSKGHPKTKTNLYGSSKASTTGAKTLTLTIKPSSRARAALAKAKKLKLSIGVTFTPAAGRKRTLIAAVTVKSR